jgi:hypothetical protein
MEKIELKNLEIGEYCMLDVISGDKTFYNKTNIKGFTGLYFRDDLNFLAIYPTEKGPIIYHKRELFPLKKDLHISLIKREDCREFCIEEYDIRIKYRTSRYIGFDVWSEEEDVDLLYQIAKYYKDDKYYERFTKKI